MPNMSYCRFQNTCSDLKDCKETMEGYDDHYQCRDDLSSDEYDAMERLIDLCRDIVDMADDERHVFVVDGNGDS
jgi:hypothetical protein